jgi:EpsD family peptidyl-prolyl cis-trans isomerase
MVAISMPETLRTRLGACLGSCGSLHGRAFLLGMTALLTLTSCGQEAKKSGSQVVATVAGEELTAPMLEAALHALPVGADTRDVQIQHKISQRLIDQMIFAREARRLELDKSPVVVRRLEAAERAILASAYVERLGVGTQPTEVQITMFFEEHPHLFAARRRYTLTDLPVRGPAAQIAHHVQAFTRDDMSIEQLIVVLKESGTSVVSNSINVTGDALPDAVARRLGQMTPGMQFTYNVDGVQHFLRLEAATDSPVSLALARDAIRDHLARQDLRARAQAELKQLRREAKIQYGDFGRSIIKASSAKSPVASSL